MKKDFIPIIKNINNKEGGLLSENFIEENYIPFVINMVMARTPDGLIVAEDLNRCPDLTKYEQYRYYFHKLSKNSRRFGEKIEVSENKYLQMVMEYFEFSRQKAQIALTILTESELNEIKKFLDEGGIQHE